MLRNRRTIWPFAILAALVLLLQGCGGASTSSPQSSQTPTTVIVVIATPTPMPAAAQTPVATASTTSQPTSIPYAQDTTPAAPELPPWPQSSDQAASLFGGFGWYHPSSAAQAWHADFGSPVVVNPHGYGAEGCSGGESGVFSRAYAVTGATIYPVYGSHQYLTYLAQVASAAHGGVTYVWWDQGS